MYVTIIAAHCPNIKRGEHKQELARLNNILYHKKVFRAMANETECACTRLM